MLFGLSITDLLTIIVSLIVALTLHEAAHAYVSFLLGDSTALDHGRISLNPLDHIDPVTTLLLPVVTLILFHAPILAAKPVPFNPDRVKFGEFGAALIALAGPGVNLALSIIGALLFHFTSNISIAYGLYIFITLNISLFIFNLIPIPPLDGSRVLFAFAPEPVQAFMRQIEPLGMMLVFGLVLLGGFGGTLDNINQFVLHALLRQ